MRPFLRSFGHWRFAACSLATGSGLSYCESPPRPLHANFIADAAEIASPAVVNLKLSAPTHRFQYGSEGVVSGSGFFLSQDGFIVTNAHVVAPVVESMNRMELMVTMADGRQFQGQVHSLDYTSDLALVQIKPDDAEPFPVLEIGESAALRAGEWVVALGSPFFLQNSVSAGIVSASARHSSELGFVQHSSEFIQTDAAINQGNSGGPLVDLQGKVVGINTFQLSQATNVSFAIPIDTAIQVINQLKKHKRVIRPYMGMSIVSFSATGSNRLATISNIYPDVKEGVVIKNVKPGSPAVIAGLQREDLVIEFDGKPVLKANDILKRVGDEIGRKIQIKIRRKGVQKPISLVLKPVELNTGGKYPYRRF